MFIYDVLNKGKVYQIVSNDLRNLGVKRRVKKQTTTTITKHNQNSSPGSEKNPSDLIQPLKKVFKTPLSHLPLDVVKLSSGAIIHVPNFLTQACARIEKCITQEGIFRKAGSHLRQREIISRLDSGGVLTEKYQVVDVANVLKTFFRELPEPLIPVCYHDVFLRCALLKNTSKIEAILLACILLPPHHLNALAFFAEFLKRVSEHEKLNKMNVDNLAKVIAPSLMPIQETTMNAIQARLETQLIIIKILIENAERIGVLPEHVADFVTSESIGSVETELDASDSTVASRSKTSKKKKRRSGSLTRKTSHLSASNLNLRMLNGLKKMVSKSGSPDEASTPSNQVSSTDFNPAHTPSIKTGKKRKVLEGAAAPLSAKKKREVLQTMPDGGLNRQGNILASLISNDPNPCKEKSPVQKSKVKKYLSQKVHNETTTIEKPEKTKKIRLSLDRLVSKSKQKIADLDSNIYEKPDSPKIERRWSSVSGSSWSKKKRGVYDPENVDTQSEKSKRKVREDDFNQDEVFMGADVNLSDENDAVDDAMSEELMEIDRRNSANFGNSHLDPNQGDEEYVTIPKSEYEEIKNRVSAIESRISQEFGSISTNVAQNLASKVQSEYEKTLEEASIGNTATADHLAKRLGKELKIRRSAENKIIRSPSARKIGNLRRRSQERNGSGRQVSWLISPKQNNASSEQLNNLSLQKSSLKRGRPNTIYTGLTQPNNNSSSQPILNTDTLCSDETNARLDFLQKQLHTLINHTVEHTKGSLSDDEVFINDCEDAIKSGDNIGRTAEVRRASSFHGSDFIDNSIHFNRKMRELKKSNSQQDVGLNNERLKNDKIDNAVNSADKNVTWKDADCYFASDYRTRTPAKQTGRASVAKLRTQNAGMVLAKAKLFDDCDSSKKQKKKETNNRRQSVKPRDLDNSNNSKKGGGGTPRRQKHSSKSPKNNNAKLKLLRSPGSSPLIKMELTIMPSHNQQNIIETRGSRYDKSKTDDEYSILKESNKNILNIESNTNTPCNTPHIKRPLTLKTPKDAKNLIRKQGVDPRIRTPMKAVALHSSSTQQLNTPRRQSPRSVIKSRQLTRSVS